MRWNCEVHVRQKSPATVEPNCLLTSFCMCQSALTTHNPRDARTTHIRRHIGEKCFKPRHNSWQIFSFTKNLRIYLSIARRILEYQAKKTKRRLVSRAKKETEGQGMSGAQRQGTHGGRTRERKGNLSNKILIHWQNRISRMTLCLSVIIRVFVKILR